MVNLPIHTTTIGFEQQPTVNARDLHNTLEVGKDFTTWIKDRIQTYGFTEGEEFSPILGKNTQDGFLSRGRPKTEYFLTLEMAKELALVENTPTGRIIRRQLIEAERQLREDVPALLRKLQKRNQQLQTHIFALQPVYRDIQRYYNAGLTQREMGKLLDKSDTSVREILKKMSQLNIIDYQPNPKLVKQGHMGKAAQMELRGTTHA